jgi:hypothetical protein
MKSLDEELSHELPSVREKARDQIFNMLKVMGMSRSTDEESVGDNRTVIFNQFFGGTKSPIGDKIRTMDDLILLKRKERGLETEIKDAEVLRNGMDDEEEERSVESTSKSEKSKSEVEAIEGETGREGEGI